MKSLDELLGNVSGVFQKSERDERQRILELISSQTPKRDMADQIRGFIDSIGSRITPIRITPDIKAIAERQTRGIYDFEIKGYALFDWFEHNMRYYQGNGRYKNSAQTLRDRMGNFLDMAFLYIAMARSINMESNFVSVKIDLNGKSVNHACASLHNRSNVILVDPAYHTYDAKHRQVEIYDDLKLMGMRLNIF